MNGLPFIAGCLEVEQQIGAFLLQIRKEEHPTRYLGIVGMPSRPLVPFSNDSQFCEAIVSNHAFAFSGAVIVVAPDAVTMHRRLKLESD